MRENGDSFENQNSDYAFQINNADRQGNTIVSKITNTLQTLKTLSAVDQKLEESHKQFDLFTHHAKIRNKEFLYFTYDALRQAVLELFLSVKIRSDEEIENYNEAVFKEEQKELADLDGFTLIDQIKATIEMLMNCKQEEMDESDHPDLFTDVIKIDRINANNRLTNPSDIIKLEDLHISIALKNKQLHRAGDLDVIPVLCSVESEKNPKVNISSILQEGQAKDSIQQSENRNDSLTGSVHLFEKSPSSTVWEL